MYRNIDLHTSHQKHISYCTKLRVLSHDQYGSARRPKKGGNGRTRPSAQRYSWKNGWRGNLPYKFRYLQLQKITWSKHLFAFLSKGMTSLHWLCWKNHDWTVEKWPEYSDTKLWVKSWELHTFHLSATPLAWCRQTLYMTRILPSHEQEGHNQ